MREKLQTLPLSELKEMAKSRGIKGISSLRKAEIIDLLCDEAEKNPDIKPAEIKREVKTETSRSQETGADRNTGADPETGLDETQLQAMICKVRELSREKIEAGYKVGVICTDESRGCYTDGEVRSIGARKSQASVAHNLYALLREFDDLGVDYIFSESFPKDHLGQAIMNRLSKAAGYKIVKV